MNSNLKILFLTYTHSKGGGGEAVLTTLVNNLHKTWQIDILEVIHFDVKEEPINQNIKLLPPLIIGARKKGGAYQSFIDFLILLSYISLS